jgi:hypothetical protein
MIVDCVPVPRALATSTMLSYDFAWSNSARFRAGIATDPTSLEIIS